MKIDYSEVTNLNSTYSNRIEDWKKKLTEKDGIILELRKKITELEAEIEKLKSELVSKSIYYQIFKNNFCSVSNKDKILLEKEKMITDLNNQIAKLNADITNLKSQLDSATHGFENAKGILEKEILVRFQNNYVLYLNSMMHAHRN